jgi:hypothetical protein
MASGYQTSQDDGVTQLPVGALGDDCGGNGRPRSSEKSADLELGDWREVAAFGRQ